MKELLKKFTNIGFKKYAALLMAVAMILSALAVTNSNQAEAATTLKFSPRFTQQASDNKYFYSDSYNVFTGRYAMPNCTAYAYGRAYEILVTAYGENTAAPKLGSWMACNFYPNVVESKAYEVGSEPRLGAIACWGSSSSGGSGHVAVVEQINSDGTMIISGASSGSKVHFRTRTIKQDGSDYSSGYVFQGYIYILPKDANIKVISPMDEEVKEVIVDDPDVPNVTVAYKSHVQTFGWEKDYSEDGEKSGTMGLAKRLEGIQIKIIGNENLGVRYTTHVQTFGWQSWSSTDEVSGTEGLAKRLEAIKIELTGADKDKYDIYYRVHCQSYGWLDWASNGEEAGSAGYAKRLESIQIVIREKGSTAPTADDSNYSMAYVCSSTENKTVIPGDDGKINVITSTFIGGQQWTRYLVAGGTVGVTDCRTEGLIVKLANSPVSGGVVYSAYMQRFGWTENRRDGLYAGLPGQGLRMEAIRISLYGDVADNYDIIYRANVETFGWLGWAANGDEAGTSGLAKKLCAYQILIVPKGQAAEYIDAEDPAMIKQ